MIYAYDKTTFCFRNSSREDRSLPVTGPSNIFRKIYYFIHPISFFLFSLQEKKPPIKHTSLLVKQLFAILTKCYVNPLTANFVPKNTVFNRLIRFFGSQDAK